MARLTRMSKRDRAKEAQRLMLSLPSNMSVEGAHKMEDVIAYLYKFRAITLDQLLRLFPGIKKKRMWYWLERYPYISKRSETMERFNVERRVWIHPRNMGVYTLKDETVFLYESINRLEENGYSGSEDTNHAPKKPDNILHAVELITRAWQFDPMMLIDWIPNQLVAHELKEKGVLEKRMSLSTTGFFKVEEKLWGVGVYVNGTNAIISNTKKMFLPQYHGHIEGVMLVRNAHLARVHELAFKSERPKGVSADLYFRFVPYEFSLEHPKWFNGILYENRWLVLNALIEHVKQTGGKVETTVHHAYHYRVIHLDGRVEYIDTSYGAKFMEIIDLLTYNVTEKATYTLYVSDESEIKAYKAIINNETVNIGEDGPRRIAFRLIDWPGGK